MDSNKSRSPKYAIISLPEDFDLPNATEKLKQIGFPAVQFVHNLSDYMEQREETREKASKEDKIDKNGTNYRENAVKMENMDTLLSQIASPVVDDSRSVASKQQQQDCQQQQRRRRQQQQDCQQQQQQQQQDDDVIVIDEFLRSSRSRNGFSSLPVVPKQMTLEEAIKREQKLYELHKEAAVNKDEDDDSIEIIEDSETSSQQQQFPISSTTNDMISCMVCHKNLTYKGSINGLIAHAKRHHYLKPYGCPLCDYGSTVALQVRQHLYHKHRAYLKPDVHIDDTMRDVWLKLATKCFPEVADRFEQHTFSKPRSPKVLNIGMFNFDNLVLPLPTSPSL